MKTQTNGHEKLIHAFESSLNESNSARDIVHDGIVAERNLTRVVILLVEDNSGDIVLLKRAFSLAGLQHDFLIARDGQAALSILRRGGDSKAHLPIPTHVLLDLDLPLIGGLEVLAWIRASSNWSGLPVIVLSGSDLAWRISAAQQHGIDACLPKGTEFADTKAAVARISEIWNLRSLAIEPHLSPHC